MLPVTNLTPVFSPHFHIKAVFVLLNCLDLQNTLLCCCTILSVLHILVLSLFFSSDLWKFADVLFLQASSLPAAVAAGVGFSGSCPSHLGSSSGKGSSLMFHRVLQRGQNLRTRSRFQKHPWFSQTMTQRKPPPSKPVDLYRPLEAGCSHCKS